MAVLEMLRKASADGDADFLREGVRVLAAALMEAGVTAITGVPKGERAPESRLTNRNGYRERRWDTRVGTIASGRRGCDPGLLQLIHPSSCGGLTLVLCSTLLPPYAARSCA
jgi:hypothetical protein